jgi:hypothetical protein
VRVWRCVRGRLEGSAVRVCIRETRQEARPRSEAQSYWNVTEGKDWFGKWASVRWRTLMEEFARDSFENLLFSLCRFRELTGHYPSNLTVVSYDFKQPRFTDLHRHALRFPEPQRGRETRHLVRRGNGEDSSVTGGERQKHGR